MKLQCKFLVVCNEILITLLVNQILIVSANLEQLNGLMNNDGNLTKVLHRNKRAAVLDHALWEYAVIPYEIENIFTQNQLNLIQQAMREWEKYTCLRFVYRNPRDHPNYVVITKKSCGCCSDIGNQRRGAQHVSIGKNCDTLGIIIHELGHAIGYYHEQTRPDRDEYIYVIKENIKDGQEHNFVKKKFHEVNTNGQPYDYQSIMHYGKDAFADDNSFPVIIPKNKKLHHFPNIGQRIKISEGDKVETNLLYKCAPCGQSLLENSGKMQISSNNLPPDRGTTCEWRITANEGKQIIVDISLNIRQSLDCRSDYVLIIDGYWQKSPTIGRYCGNVQMNSIVSSSNRMLIIYVKASRENINYGFTAQYRVSDKTINSNKVNSNDLKKSASITYKKPMNYEISNDEYIIKRPNSIINSHRMSNILHGLHPNKVINTAQTILQKKVSNLHQYLG